MYPHKSEPLADFTAVWAKRGEKTKEDEARPDLKLEPRGAVAAKKVRLDKGFASLAAMEERAYARWSRRFVEVLKAGGGAGVGEGSCHVGS